MKETFYRPNYHYEGTEWTKELKGLAKAVFHEIRSKWVPLINENIGAFNTEFEELHPELKGTVYNDQNVMDQANFICEKMKPLNDQFNKENLWWSTFYVTCQKDTSDFMMVIKGTNSTVYCTYIPVEMEV